jgi:GT2 family glycosyltransferase
VNLTICVPTYNGERYLAATLSSILAQTYADFHLLVVDDCSGDATVQVARSFDDPRLRIVVGPQRRGIGGVCNHCLELADTEFVYLIGHDDLMHPENLERKMRLLQSDPAIGMVHSSSDLLVEEAAPPPPTPYKGPEDYVAEGRPYLRRLLLEGNHICASSVLARRKAMLDAGGFDEELNYACDYEMWMKLCVLGRVGFLCQPLVQYRWHGHNVSHNYQYEKRLEEIYLAGQRALRFARQNAGWAEEAEVLDAALTAVTRANRCAAAVEGGKAWLLEQCGSWQRLAHHLEQQCSALQRGAAALEEGKAWLVEQLGNWQRHAAGLAEQYAALQRSAAKLEEGKTWLAGQVANWQQRAAGLEEANTRLQQEANAARRLAEERERIVRQLHERLPRSEAPTPAAPAQDPEGEVAALRAALGAYESSFWMRLGLRLKTIKRQTHAA